MPQRIGREIHLRSRPTGLPDEDNFELVETFIPSPAEGQILVRNLWMSVDPYMRGRMKAGRGSYVEPFEVGHVLEGSAIGEVVESRAAAFRPGDHVLSMNGWREWWAANAEGVTKVDTRTAPPQSYLGVLGMPGLTAYAGLLRIAEYKSGETVFVSGAAGAVGSVVCQIAKIKGGRVIASAGSDEKIAWLRDEAGVDYAFNYKRTDNILGELRKAAPDGIDVYFDNVGGGHLDAALRHLKNFGRIAVCGMISGYNAETPPPGPPSLFMIVVRRIRMQGFIVHDHRDLLPSFFADMSQWIAQGRMKWRETIVEGLENAPRAFIGLFHGENVGKMLVKIGS